MENLKRDRSDHLDTDQRVRPHKIAKLDSTCSPGPIVIIHDPSLQKLMKQKRIPYGIQYELARVLANDPDSMLKYQNIVMKLQQRPYSHSDLFDQLFTSNSVAGNLSEREVASTAPWKELDKEEEAFSKDPLYAGIGNNPAYPGWWAGSVIFAAKLEETGHRIVLERAMLGPSNKIQRRFGSSSVLRVKIPTKRFFARQNGLILFFKRPIVIWNNVFRAFFAKDNTVFFFKTNEAIFEDRIISDCLSKCRSLPFDRFIDWLNPLEDNSQQKLCKWASRLALGLSSSVPGPRLKQEEISYASDLILDQLDPSSNLTDGCSTSNLALHKLIFEMFCERLQLQDISAAIQFRLAGAKGLVLLTDRNTVDHPQVILRSPSQIKIRYPSIPFDPSHLTMDLLRFSRTKTPAKLSEEVIKNLHHNGVPPAVFVELLQQRLQDVVDGLTTWTGLDAMCKLWKAVENAENVIGARKARVSPTDSRVKGYGAHEDEDEDEEGVKHEVSSQPWWADPFSGCPSSIAETVMELLDSGFTPLNSPYLRDKLKQCVKSKVKTLTAKFNYVLPQSGSAFAVPDPFNVLGPDQIHFKNSRRDFVNKEGVKTDIILGEVLMTRNPCKVPSDVRKVTAVQHPALAEMLDVVVCSIQGNRRLIDYCGGGDFDGDRLLVIWNELFVKPFTNADEKYSKAPRGLENCFSMDGRSVAQLCTGTKISDRLESELQDHLLSSLKDPYLVGEYSRIHENAVYKHGYANWRSIKLAYKFCIVLDFAKTGHQIEQKTYLADRKEYSHPIGPFYKLTDKQKSNSSNDLPLQRGEDLPRFIMDILHDEASKQRQLWLIEVENRFNNTPLNLHSDADLTAPWQDFYNEARKRNNQAILGDLKIISDHVEEMYKREMYKQRVETYVNPASGTFTSQPITVRQDKIRELSRRFVSFPGPRDLKTLMEPATITRLRASYAYMYAVRRSGAAAQFPFDRAFRDLCTIKAQADGRYKAVLQSMHEYRR